tara:strand:+ start:2995 stop:4041 length:1047 start_codon:yes stop_codon:yes gene_type:complete
MLKKKILKFGKSFKDIEAIKKNFFRENNNLLKSQDKINKIYQAQPKRTKCKACNLKLNGPSFLNHGIKYIECNKCTHVNGYHQDNTLFSEKIYVTENKQYAKTYHETNLKKFKIRQKNIYDPKALFLKNCFKNPKKIKVLDVGAGSGYFISSLIKYGFQDVSGVEISRTQVKLGKKFLEKIHKRSDKLSNITFNEIIKLVDTTDFNCLSMIGSLEHMEDMSTIMKSIKKNKKIKYLYILVPMASFLCVVENLFPKVFNRQLGGGHTHLFSEKSLTKFMNNYGFVDYSSWWFGTDVHDLYRSIILDMEEKKYKPLQNIALDMKNIIDNLQFQLDKKKISSEVHMLLKRK